MDMKQIKIRQNPHFPHIEVKLGANQYSRHSHIHDVWSFSYVLHGTTTVRLGTWKSELAKDEFITIPRGIPHLCSPEPDLPFSFAVLYVPDEHLNTQLDNQESEFQEPRLGSISPHAVFDFINLFMTAKNKNELQSGSLKLQNILQINSSPIAAGWGENLMQKKDERPQHSEGSRFRHYRDTRKRFGIGPKKLSTIDKMEKAKNLISSEMDLVEIALECGFYDQSHFSKVFKLYTGLTPAQYRKR